MSEVKSGVYGEAGSLADWELRQVLHNHSWDSVPLVPRHLAELDIAAAQRIARSCALRNLVADRVADRWVALHTAVVSTAEGLVRLGPGLELATSAMAGLNRRTLPSVQQAPRACENRPSRFREVAAN
jgi:hypothetical protein